MIPEARAALIRSYLGWKYGDAVDRLEQAVCSSRSAETVGELREVREGFLEADRLLLEISDPNYEFPDDLVRELAAREVDAFELSLHTDDRSYGDLAPAEHIREQIRKLELWVGMLDKVGWPEPDEGEEAKEAA